MHKNGLRKVRLWKCGFDCADDSAGDCVTGKRKSNFVTFQRWWVMYLYYIDVTMMLVLLKESVIQTLRF